MQALAIRQKEPGNDIYRTPAVAGRCESGDERHAGPYRLTRVLGSGSMGQVFVGEHVVLGRKVAVKVMRKELADDRHFVKRFIAEGRAATRVSHPNVVRVTDLARDPDGTIWLAMELLEGRDLASLLGDPSLTLRRAVSITRQLCLGLAAVHAQGVVHRDVKPGNVFVTPSEDDGADVVTLLDFGIARAPNDGLVDVEVAQGNLIGTPEYMAPEQAWGHEVDGRCDLYSVGAVLFELITSRPMFERGSIEEMVSATIFAKPPPLGQYVRIPDEVRGDLENLVHECVAKHPEQRPSSATEVAERLAEIEARLPPDPAYRDWTRCYEPIDARASIETAPTASHVRRNLRPGSGVRSKRPRQWAVACAWIGLAWCVLTTQAIRDTQHVLAPHVEQLAALALQSFEVSAQALAPEQPTPTSGSTNTLTAQ